MDSNPWDENHHEFHHHLGWEIVVIFSNNRTSESKTKIQRMMELGQKEKQNWVVVYFLKFWPPYLEKMSNLTNIFQMGWNHQLEKQIGAGVYSSTTNFDRMFWGSCCAQGKYTIHCVLGWCLDGFVHTLR